ncbi:MAG: hypothetical protein HFG69_15920 [Hungatella sp.]|nr:hypothetical protein [Hungatella sp.]
MLQRKYSLTKKYSVLFLSICTAAILGACTPKHPKLEEIETKGTQPAVTASTSGPSQNNGDSDKKSSKDIPTAETPDPIPAPDSKTPAAPAEETPDLAARFGEHCIAGQTFEVDLSEYGGKVYFVPFSPSEGQGFHMQIIQDDKVLTDIPGYVPDKLSGEPFTSLDAVSFYDVNFDGNTDIMLIETYGSTSFAAVYYGFDADAEDYGRNFTIQEQLSDNITQQVPPLSVSQIRILLSGGKRNGEFSDYKEAYRAVARLWKLAESDDDILCSLIYVDEDDIPELAVGLNGYYTSLYTYNGGKVYTIMDHWSYGVMGNAGYEYSPRKNSIRNTNTDYAGAILYTTYLSVTPSHSLDTIAQIVFYNFDDVNKNGIPDEDEMGSMGMYGVSYLNGVEATNEQCAAYDAGGYEFIGGTMSLEALMSSLD